MPHRKPLFGPDHAGPCPVLENSLVCFRLVGQYLREPKNLSGTTSEDGETEAMSLKFQCPGCGTRYALQDPLAGKSVKCKKCGETVRVPTNGSTDVDQGAALIRLTCEGCGKAYNLPAHLGGKRARCKACGHDMRIPAAQKAFGGLELDAMAPPPADVYGLDESPALPCEKADQETEFSRTLPLPKPPLGLWSMRTLCHRAGYEPMTDAKRKTIAKRAAKAQSSGSFSGTGIGVSFGTVLMITLLLGRFYFRFQRGANGRKTELRDRRARRYRTSSANRGRS